MSGTWSLARPWCRAPVVLSARSTKQLTANHRDPLLSGLLASGRFLKDQLLALVGPYIPWPNRRASSWVGPSPSLHRQLLGSVFNLLLRIILGLRFKDTQCGFKAFTRRTAQTILSFQRIERWGFDPEILPWLSP